MLWIALILGMLLVTGAVVTLAVIALRCLQNASEVSQSFLVAHTRTLESLERTHERNVAQNSGVLDRFMALDFSVFKAYQSTEGAEEGGFVDPDDPDEEGSVVKFLPNGRLVDLNASTVDRLKQAVEENELIREDFGDDFWEKEDARA